MYDRVKKAADVIREKCGDAEIGLILGSGLADSITPDNCKTIAYEDIPGFPVPTVEGHRSEWVSGTLFSKKVCMMRGRFHYYEGWSGEDLVMPVRVMKLLGVKTLIVTNAAGGINESFRPGELMLIRDHINFNGMNPLIGDNDEHFGVRFPDMSSAYDKDLAKIAHECADDENITLHEGVYIWFSGPSYETPAEIRMARIIGADAAGMSTVPEVTAACHCGIKVLGISCITNMAAGVNGVPLSHEEVISAGAEVRDRFASLVTRIIEKI